MFEYLRRNFVVSGRALLLSLAIPSLALAEEAAEHHVASISDLSLHYINFAIYIALILYFVPSAFRTAWGARRDRIEQAVAASREILEKADARLTFARSQLSRVRSESDAIAIEIEKSAKLEAEKMVDDARAKGLQIISHAKTLAATERRAALSKVRRDVVDKVIEQARNIIASGHSSQKDKALRQAAMSGVKQIVH